MAQLYGVSVGLPLVKDKTSYFVVSGDQFDDGYTVTVSGNDFGDVDCATRYIKMPQGVPDLLVAKWLRNTVRPITGEVNVTITVRDASKKVYAQLIAPVVQIVDGDLPSRRRPAKKKGKGKGKKTKKKSVTGGK
jgi:hypothetical protein